MYSKRAIFLDRDGVLIKAPKYKKSNTPFRGIPGYHMAPNNITSKDKKI